MQMTNDSSHNHEGPWCQGTEVFLLDGVMLGL